MDAYREVENLAETIRALGNNPRIDTILDEILVKCRGYMEKDQAIPCPWLAESPSRRMMFDLLLRRRGQVVSRSSLMDVCFSQVDSEPSYKIADVHMCHLRAALKGTPYENMIETVWGRGYRLRTEAEGPFIPRIGKCNGAKFYSERYT